MNNKRKMKKKYHGDEGSLASELLQCKGYEDRLFVQTGLGFHPSSAT
jgi:hypothetical protein